MDTGLITSVSSISASGVGLAVGAVLVGLSVFFSLLMVATWKSLKTLAVKQGKHNAVKLLAQSKLDSMANIILQAM